MAHVLIVDDDADLVRLIELQLQRQGHRTSATTTGEQALELMAEDGPPDVALVDLRMPGMSGAELLSRLRERYGDVPVIFLTGASPSEVEAATEGDACAYLTKPFTSAGLLDAMIGLIPLTRSA